MKIERNTDTHALRTGSAAIDADIISGLLLHILQFGAGVRIHLPQL